MQSDFAEGFVNAMLGWMRSLAAAIANMFRTRPNQQPGSATMFDWFKDNWVGLLIALIVIGVAIDWIVWILRWRPHWLWFKKRRIVLDDEVRENEPYEPAQRFYSHALRYEDDSARDANEDWDMGDHAAEDDYPNDYEDDFEDGYPVDFDDDFEEDFKRDVIPFDDEDLPDRDEDAPLDDYDEYEPDDEDSDFDDEDDYDSAPDKKSVMSLFKKREKDDDPFYISDDDYRELDDDFYAVVSEDPRKESNPDAEQSRKARRRRTQAGRDGKV